MTLSRPRVALRLLAKEDLHALPSWYKRGRVDLNGSLLAIHHTGKIVGVLGYQADAPEDGWLAFQFVAVEPGLQGLGLESEAVRLAEDDALKRGLARRSWVDIHQDDGLGLYFWLRSGYRPARPGDFAWLDSGRQDIISMVRISGRRH